MKTHFCRASRTLLVATQVVAFLSVRDKKICPRPNRRPITVRRGRPRGPIYSACDWLSGSRLSLLVPCTIYTVRAQLLIAAHRLAHP